MRQPMSASDWWVERGLLKRSVRQNNCGEITIVKEKPCHRLCVETPQRDDHSLCPNGAKRRKGGGLGHGGERTTVIDRKHSPGTRYQGSWRHVDGWRYNYITIFRQKRVNRLHEIKIVYVYIYVYICTHD